MSSLLPPDLRARLGASRWVALRAQADSAVGERRSKAIGAGIEFAQHRDYEVGDDLRYLDRHVYARHRRPVVRQFSVEQRLRVTVLLDASASMGVDPEKWRRAQELAAVFGLVTINGGDQVRYGVVARGDIAWGRVASRRIQLERELDRLEAVEPSGALDDLTDVASRSMERLGPEGLLVVVSDWLCDGVQGALKRWRVRGQEVVAVQVVAPVDAEPGGDARGWLALRDVETGDVLERHVDGATLAAYREAFEAWEHELRSTVWGAEGRWFSVRSDAGTADAVQRLRHQGLVT